MKEYLKKTIKKAYNIPVSILINRARKLDDNHKNYKGDYAIVIQGPVSDNVDLIIKYYRLTQPSAVIIVSTWDDTNEELVNKAKLYADYVVLSPMPEIEGTAHVNCQIISTKNGILKAKELGCKYVLKTRSNSLLTCRNLIPKYVEWSTHPCNLEHLKYGLQKKLLVEYRKNFNESIPFTLCDFTSLGTVEDMLLFWDLKLDIGREYSNNPGTTKDTEKKIYFNKSTKQLFEERPNAVVWLALSFCDKIGYSATCSRMASIKFYEDLFIFLDQKCELLLKYEGFDDRLLTTKPMQSKRFEYIKKQEAYEIDYENEIKFDEKYFNSDSYLKYISKK